MGHMKNCSYSKEYKGIKPPTCNGGKGCPECIRIWNTAVIQRFKERDKKQKKSPKGDSTTET